MSRDYMPHAEHELAGWADKFVAFAQAHAEDISLTEDELTALVNDHEAFDSARSEYDVLAAQARGACKMKNQARRSLVDRMREIAMRIQTSPAINNGDRASLGLSLGLPREHVPLEFSDELPYAAIDSFGRLKHVLRITNKTEKGSSKARPGNATGCEVWVKVGDSPSGHEELRYVGTATDGLRVVEFSAEDGGKKAWYMLRWVGRRSAVGSWSGTFSATIAA